MTEKVQKIREEVKRLQNELIQEKEKGFGSDADDACILELQNVLTYIDSLQEEPVSEELEDVQQTITYMGEVYTRCYKDKLDAFACKYPMSVPKPSKRYAKYSDVDLTIAVKEGAKWQKEKMEKEYSDLNKGLVSAKGVAVYMAYETGKKEIIAKACKYLQDHREEVETEDNGISGWISDEFIEDFKQAMKDE